MNQEEILEQKIIKASQEYYAGESTVSDSEFDKWVDTLRALNVANKLLSNTGYGYIPGNHLEKLPHATHIGSLDKIKKEDVIEDDDFSWSDKPITASLKLDGGDVVLYYEDGAFIRALSRGNGDIGLDITKNLLPGKSFPLTIKNKDILAVRGQVLITYESFKKLGSSSPRNKAVGLSQSVHSSIEDLRHLRFVAFDVIQINESSSADDILSQKSQFLRELYDLRFFVVPIAFYLNWDHFIRCVKADKVDISKNGFGNMTVGHYPADGIVLSKETPTYSSQGKSLIIKYESIAFKFEDESKNTKIKDIEFNVSRTGRIVPVLIIDEVNLSGAKINRVTANNVSWLIQMGCGAGAEVEVVRSNEVIPMIKKTVIQVDPIVPEKCPKCKSTLTIQMSDLTCTNDNCPTKIFATLDRVFEFVMPDGIGQSTLTKIYEKFNITNLESLRKWIDTVTEHDIDNEFGVGSVTAKKIYKMVSDLQRKQFNIADVLYISNIPSVGKTSRATLNCRISKNMLWEAVVIQNKIPEDWEKYVTTRPAYENLKKDIQKIKSVALFIGLSKIYHQIDDQVEQKMKITLTGVLSKSRSVLVKEYKSFGFVESSIGSADVLICNEASSSSKYKKAQSRGIPILTESEFNNQHLNKE